MCGRDNDTRQRRIMCGGDTDTRQKHTYVYKRY